MPDRRRRKRTRSRSLFKVRIIGKMGRGVLIGKRISSGKSASRPIFFFWFCVPFGIALDHHLLLLPRVWTRLEMEARVPLGRFGLNPNFDLFSAAATFISAYFLENTSTVKYACIGAEFGEGEDARSWCMMLLSLRPLPKLRYRGETCPSFRPSISPMPRLSRLSLPPLDKILPIYDNCPHRLRAGCNFRQSPSAKQNPPSLNCLLKFRSSFGTNPINTLVHFGDTRPLGED